MLFATLVAVAAVASVALAQVDEPSVERYDGDQVVEGFVKNDATVALLDGLDIWLPDSGDVRVNQTVHVRLPSGSDKLRKQLAAANFDYSVFIEDVQVLVDHERVAMEAYSADTDDYFTAYHSYDDNVAYVKKLADAAPASANVKFFDDIGTTADGGRKLVGLTIRAGGDGGERPVFAFNGGQHAREWINPATALYVLTQLLEGYAAGDAEVVGLLEAIDIVFVPIVNPDGYEYSRASSRMWRKNRSTNQGTSCRGVDLNRNWGFKWGGSGSSGNPCSDTYRGTAAFSEPETAAMAKFIRDEGKGRVIGYIDFHSYSQLILRAYGWTRADAADEKENQEVGAEMRQAIIDTHGKAYRNIKSIELYTTTGSAGDWAYELGNGDVEGDPASKIRVAYTFELRDTGTYGFLLPPEQIIPTGEENWNAVKLMLNHLKENNCLPGKC